MKIDLKRNEAITLISLVVTIIVLIILAGVSINLILGQDGIITKAKQAKQNMELAQIEEQEQLNELYEQMITGSSGISYDSIAKLAEFKKAIADYIAEAGGAKPEYTADTNTFGESIKGIVTEVTKNATATESDIAEGKTAWVNGKLITGNDSQYNNSKSDELIPILTENNDQIIVSSEFSSGYAAYHAFNNCFQENHWRAKGDVSEVYIGYNFNKNVSISRFTLIPPVSAATYEVKRLPKTFMVQKSEDGITWENVQNYTIEATTATMHSFEFEQPIVTQYFRLYITSNNNNDNYHSIGYLQCYGDAG